MTIEEIKWWRQYATQANGMHVDIYGAIDTLLAEVELQKGNHTNTKYWLSECRKQLAVATEALNQIANHFSELPADQHIAMIMRGRGRIEDVYQYIARTALERMKG